MAVVRFQRRKATKRDGAVRAARHDAIRPVGRNYRLGFSRRAPLTRGFVANVSAAVAPYRGVSVLSPGFHIAACCAHCGVAKTGSYNDR